MAKDREKEREAELKSAMYNNYLLLSLDPSAPPSRRAAPLLPPLLPPRPRAVRQGLRPGVADLRFRAVQGVPQDCARDYKTHTTQSWDFVGLNFHQPSGLLQKAKYGEDAIVGVIGSGTALCRHGGEAHARSSRHSTPRAATERSSMRSLECLYMSMPDGNVCIHGLARTCEM